jgi:hypothetical protein
LDYGFPKLVVVLSNECTVDLPSERAESFYVNFRFDHKANVARNSDETQERGKKGSFVLVREDHVCL